MFRYSSINTAHDCLTKYKLQYVDQVQPTPDGLESIDLKFGTAMHAGLEASLHGKDSTQAFNYLWDALKGRELITSRFGHTELAAMGPKFLERFERLHSKFFKPVAIEQRLQGNIGEHGFEGTPDFLGLYKDIPSVVDFKTSNMAYQKEKVLVNEQMPIYAHLAAQVLGFKAEQVVYYVFVKSELRIQTVTAPLTKQLLDNCIKNVMIMCEDLKNRKVYPKNPNSCIRGTYKCPYFDICHGGEI